LAIFFATGANADDAEAQKHVAAAQAAVSPAVANPDQRFQVFDAFFKQWCAPPKQLPDVVRQENRRIPTSREEWYQPPVRIFDQLYFIGTKGTGVYAINSPDGIAMIDTNFDWDAKDLVLELKDFGLDPRQNLKYIVVTHGHDDRYWGAKSLQEAYPNAHVMMSALDWDVVAKDNSPESVKPRKDMIATDGQKLKLGDVTITMYITPGHTPGTISYLIPVKDKGAPHLVAEWGGTAFNFPRSPEAFKIYAASAQRFGDIAAKAGADALISNHSDYDGSKAKIPALQARKPGDPNPYVIGTDGVKRYMRVAEECSKAWEIRTRNP
jgi:metallo-beta-lactamase class B